MKLQYAPVDMLARLVDDIRLVEAGSLLASDLLDAPTLDDYRVLPLKVGMLGGVVEGHPKLRSYGDITTSQVFFIDTNLGIARTLSRWYRLGSAAQTKGHRHEVQ